MVAVPVTQLAAMRDAKQCVVLVRGLEDDIELNVSRQQFRDVLESLDDGGAGWTVCWRAATETAVLEPFGSCESVPLRYEGVSKCDHCLGWFFPNEFGEGQEGEFICHSCWASINRIVDRYGGTR